MSASHGATSLLPLCGMCWFLYDATDVLCGDDVDDTSCLFSTQKCEMIMAARLQSLAMH
jgi:hypothetical protein